MKGPTVILAAGEFPRKGGAPRAALAAARRVVCCDGAADAYRRVFNRDPAVVIGDGDSIRGAFPSFVRIEEQETNDLEKAVLHCRKHGWTNLLILGATGRREDHTLGNLFRALALGVPVLTEHGRFVPVETRAAFTVRVGAAVSIFATDRRTRMTSRGLVWPLDDVRFENLHCATLNRAAKTRVTLTTTHRVLVFIES